MIKKHLQTWLPEEVVNRLRGRWLQERAKAARKGKELLYSAFLERILLIGVNHIESIEQNRIQGVSKKVHVETDWLEQVSKKTEALIGEKEDTMP